MKKLVTIKLTPAQRVMLLVLSRRKRYTERLDTDDGKILRSFVKRGIVRQSGPFQFQYVLTEFGREVQKQSQRNGNLIA